MNLCVELNIKTTYATEMFLGKCFNKHSANWFRSICFTTSQHTLNLFSAIATRWFRWKTAQSIFEEKLVNLTRFDEAKWQCSNLTATRFHIIEFEFRIFDCTWFCMSTIVSINIGNSQSWFTIHVHSSRLTLTGSTFEIQIDIFQAQFVLQDTKQSLIIIFAMEKKKKKRWISNIVE